MATYLLLYGHISPALRVEWTLASTLHWRPQEGRCLYSSQFLGVPVGYWYDRENKDDSPLGWRGLIHRKNSSSDWSPTAAATSCWVDETPSVNKQGYAGMLSILPALWNGSKPTPKRCDSSSRPSARHFNIRSIFWNIHTISNTFTTAQHWSNWIYFFNRLKKSKNQHSNWTPRKIGITTAQPLAPVIRHKHSGSFSEITIFDLDAELFLYV